MNIQAVTALALLLGLFAVLQLPREGITITISFP